MTIAIMGIDISKAKFDVALSVGNKFKYKKFNNNINGFQDIDAWLKKHSISDLHACMEATGNYGEQLALHLHDSGIKVSVVNPARIKGYAQCELSRTKTDKADAHMIARFCQALKPDFWQPKPLKIRELQQWVRRIDSLQRMMRQECNRRGSSHYADVVDMIDKHIAALDEQIAQCKAIIKRIIMEHNDLHNKLKLLESIPGVGENTIALTLAFFGEPNDFGSAKEVSAYLGLNPRQYQSGSSVNGRTRISKTGDSNLRKALYMPALTAIKYNPLIREFANNLLSRGKAKKAVVVAAMRKLVHIIYGVLKSGLPFNSAQQQEKTA